MLTTRELTRAEWPRLALTPIAAVLDRFPTDTRIVVVEDAAGLIVAEWALIRYVHVEGVWIAPEHQKRGRVAGLLLRAMYAVARSWGVSAVLTCADDDQVRGLVDHLGGRRLPGDHYVLPIGGG